MSYTRYITKIIRKGNLSSINIDNGTVPFMGLNVNPIISNQSVDISDNYLFVNKYDRIDNRENMSSNNIYNKAPLCISDKLYDKNEVIDKLICYRRYPEILRLDSSNQWRLFENLCNIKNGYNGDPKNIPEYYTDVSIVEIDCTLCKSGDYLEWLLNNSKECKKNRLGVRISGYKFNLKNNSITDEFIRAIDIADFVNLVGNKYELYNLKKVIPDKPIIITPTIYTDPINNINHADNNDMEVLLRYGATLVNYDGK